MPNPETRGKIFIIDGSAINRVALRLLLEVEGGFRVVGGAADSAQALVAAHDAQPDLLLLDLPASVLLNSEVLGSLAHIAPIVALVPALERPDIVRAVGYGVRGVILKGVATPEHLFRCIRVVMSGQYWIDQETIGDLVRRLRPKRQPRSRPGENFGLTARELDIIGGLAAGLVNKEIAKRFDISEKTVKHHLTNIFDKLGISNRVELVLFAVHHNLVSSPGPGRDPLTE